MPLALRLQIDLIQTGRFHSESTSKALHLRPHIHLPMTEPGFQCVREQFTLTHRPVRSG